MLCQTYSDTFHTCSKNCHGSHLKTQISMTWPWTIRVIETTTQVSQHWYRRNRRPHLQVPWPGGKFWETVRRLDFWIDFFFPLGGFAPWILFLGGSWETFFLFEKFENGGGKWSSIPNSVGKNSLRKDVGVGGEWRQCWQVEDHVWIHWFGRLGRISALGFKKRRLELEAWTDVTETRVILMEIFWSTKIFKPYFHQKFRRGKSPTFTFISFFLIRYIFFTHHNFQTNLSKKSGEEQRNEKGIKIIFQVLAERFPRSEISSQNFCLSMLLELYQRVHTGFPAM